MAEVNFWGATLDKENGTEVWDPNRVPDANDGSQHNLKEEHILIVREAIIGPQVPDNEINIIEMETMGYNSNIKCPVVVMKGGTHQSQCVLDLNFTGNPVIFRLVKGNGPIHLVGNHLITNDLMNDEEEEILTAEEEEEILKAEEEEEILKAGEEEEEISEEDKKLKIAAISNVEGGKAPKSPKINSEVD